MWLLLHPWRCTCAVDQARLDEIRTALEGQVEALPEGYRADWLLLASKFAEAQPRPSFL
jgi:hypothetical protein